MEDRTTLTDSENKLQYCDMSGTILRIKNKANCAAKERPGDYRDENGFLVCGTCGQPREAILPAYETENFTFGGGRVAVTCRCDEEREEQEHTMTLTELATAIELATTDYAAAIAVAKRSYTEAEELMGAIFEKINDRKVETETRRKTLEDIVSDRTRLQSTRTLAKIEFDEMGAPDLKVGDAERCAFVDKIQQGV